MSLALASPAFGPGAEIPARFTCDGDEISPPLKWTDAPEGTRSFALIVEDPDAPDPAAPQRTFVHWILYDLPASVSQLAEGLTASDLPPGAYQGVNDFKRPDYGGPCPPRGRHRYFHKLYALDTTLGDRGSVTKAELEDAMEGHILETAELIGTYERVG